MHRIYKISKLQNTVADNMSKYLPTAQNIDANNIECKILCGKISKARYLDIKVAKHGTQIFEGALENFRVKLSMIWPNCNLENICVVAQQLPSISYGFHNAWCVDSILNELHYDMKTVFLCAIVPNKITSKYCPDFKLLSVIMTFPQISAVCLI